MNLIVNNAIPVFKTIDWKSGVINIMNLGGWKKET